MRLSGTNAIYSIDDLPHGGRETGISNATAAGVFIAVSLVVIVAAVLIT